MEGRLDYSRVGVLPHYLTKDGPRLATRRARRSGCSARGRRQWQTRCRGACWRRLGARARQRRWPQRSPSWCGGGQRSSCSCRKTARRLAWKEQESAAARRREREGRCERLRSFATSRCCRRHLLGFFQVRGDLLRVRQRGVITGRKESALFQGVLHCAGHEDGEVSGTALNGCFSCSGYGDSGRDDRIRELDYIGSYILSGQGEHVLECRSLSLAPGEGLAAGAEELADGGDDRGVLIVSIVNYGAARDAWGDEDSGHAHSEPGEVEDIGRPRGRHRKVVVDGLLFEDGWRLVVKDSTVLVVDDEEQRCRPVGTLGQSLVNLTN